MLLMHNIHQIYSLSLISLFVAANNPLQILHFFIVRFEFHSHFFNPICCCHLICQLICQQPAAIVLLQFGRVQTLCSRANSSIYGSNLSYWLYLFIYFLSKTYTSHNYWEREPIYIYRIIPIQVRQIYPKK